MINEHNKYANLLEPENKKKVKKFDNLSFGLISALCVAFIANLGFYFYNIKLFKTPTGYVEQLVNMNIYSEIISLCAVPNLLLFFFFLQTLRHRSARGVILLTFIFAFIVLIFKMV